MVKNHIYKLTLKEEVGKGKFKKGSVYIGQHNGKRSYYYTGGKLPKSIIKSRGKSVFEREILAEGYFNQNLIDELEIHYIRLYGAFRLDNKEKGLNLTSGGSGIKDQIGMNSGESHGATKFKHEDITEIFNLYNSGNFSQADVAKVFNTSQPVIYSILNKRNWKYHPGKLDKGIKNKIKNTRKNANTKHSDELFQKMIDEYVLGEVTTTALCKKYKIKRGTFSPILCGKKRKHLNTEGVREVAISNQAKGESNHSKLTESQVLEIRKERKELGTVYRLLAPKYNISESICAAICRREKWKHI